MKSQFNINNMFLWGWTNQKVSIIIKSSHFFCLSGDVSFLLILKGTNETFACFSEFSSPIHQTQEAKKPV